MRNRDWPFSASFFSLRRFRRSFQIVCLLLATAVTATPVLAAIPPVLPDDGELPELAVTADRWQRFLLASRGRYQALAEKSEVVHSLLLNDCVEGRWSLSERRECLRADVFARMAMERDGMALDEYAALLHLTVAAVEPGQISASQRGQFQRLRAEWWPVWRTASQ